ncbi:MAG: citrate lyase acyl carrier protein [Muribaculaceae bacterium]|nr:citrate lyase acyl carrier protein [Muribaculaceae bacterium]
MEIKNAVAGTLESGDIQVQIAPNENNGLQINLESSVAFQFGEQIKKVITETLTELGIDNALVQANDKGALDCTIRARVTAAAVRATGKDVWK